MFNSTLEKVKQEVQEKRLSSIKSQRNRRSFPGVPERTEIPQLAHLPLLYIWDQHRSSDQIPRHICPPAQQKGVEHSEDLGTLGSISAGRAGSRKLAASDRKRRLKSCFMCREINPEEI